MNLTRKLRRAYERKHGIGLPELPNDGKDLTRRERRARLSRKIIAPGAAREGERLGRRLSQVLLSRTEQSKVAVLNYLDWLNENRRQLFNALILDPVAVKLAFDE